MCSGNCICKKYKVYKIESDGCYSGYSLVAAETPMEAEQYIKNYKENDTNNNGNSFGYYDKITEEDLISGLFAEEPGIIYYGILYCG